MYRFQDLPHEQPGEELNREELFARSEQMMNEPYTAVDDRGKIMEQLHAKLHADEQYYVLHERMLYKGKTAKYIGQVVIASGCDLIPFLGNALDKNDLRPMRILAVHAPESMLRFTDETVLCIFGRRI